MTKQYRLTEPVTLNGIPAGPNIDDNYLDFVAGDVVVVIPAAGWRKLAEGVVVARRVGGQLEQELDRSSLVEV